MARIFIVDDNALIRSKLRRLLEQHSEWEVVAEARNGRDAVETFAACAPDVTLMDLQMPEMNGLDASRHLGQKHPGTPILIVTLDASKQLEDEARKIGVMGVCPKSQIQCVIRATEALLGGHTYFPSDRSSLQLKQPSH